MERLDVFMARANAAYYATRDPFLDFTTASEISQVFGELLGAWAAVVWRAMDSPDPVLLVECGPGRGTLMADALRAVASVAPAFRAALRVHLVENSPRLRAMQAVSVPDAVWHDALAGVPDGPMVLLANEFLDALPVRQFVCRAGVWMERYVEAGAFVEVTSGVGFGEATDGTVREVGAAAQLVGADLGERLARSGGAALFLDYGPELSCAGDSLQAVRGGRSADPLVEPGSADLTAHVDFQAVAEAARRAGAAVFGPLPQGKFLAELGLFQRTGVLARTQAPARATALLEGARRLAEPDGMGRLFKALALCHPGLPVPPGFLA